MCSGKFYCHAKSENQQLSCECLGRAAAKQGLPGGPPPGRQRGPLRRRAPAVEDDLLVIAQVTIPNCAELGASSSRVAERQSRLPYLLRGLPRDGCPWRALLTLQVPCSHAHCCHGLRSWLFDAGGCRWVCMEAGKLACMFCDHRRQRLPLAVLRTEIEGCGGWHVVRTAPLLLPLLYSAPST